MSDSELEDKFRDLSSGFVEPEAIEQFIKRIYHLEDIEDVTELVSLTSA